VSVRFVDHLGAAQVDQLVDLYSREWWTSSRSRADVELMLASTQVVVGCLDDETDELVAFARVLTDRVFHGTLLDVIVRDDRRGTGLGTRIMDHLLALPELSRLRALGLKCRDDKVSFYERWGFRVTRPLPAVAEQTTGAEMVLRRDGST